MKESLNLLEKLKVEYPDLRLSLTQEVDDKFVPTTYIYMDGERIVSWSTETAQALKTLHNVCVEDVMFENVKECIEEHLEFKSANKDISDKIETMEECIERRKQTSEKELKTFTETQKKIVDELTARYSEKYTPDFDCRLVTSLHPLDLSPIIGIEINGKAILTHKVEALDDAESIIEKAVKVIDEHLK